MISKRNIIIGALVLVLVVLGAVWFFYAGRPKEQSASHEIQGIPYFGLVNATRLTEPAAAVLAITRYWGINTADPLAFDQKYNTVGYDEVGGYFRNNGLEVATGTLHSIADIKKYIDSNTPLFVPQKTTEGTPGFAKLPARVVIGYDDTKRVVIVNDYWLGPALEIGYDTFFNLLDPQNPYYVAAYPKNRPGIAPSSSTADYFSLTPGERQTFYAYLLFARASSSQFSQTSTAYQFFNENFLQAKSFADMPPVFKMIAYDRLGYFLETDKDYADALTAYSTAATFNHDLDKASGKWPGTLFTSGGKLPYVPYYLGALYSDENNKNLAIKNFEDAFAIDPSFRDTKSRLQELGVSQP